MGPRAGSLRYGRVRAVNSPSLVSHSVTLCAAREHYGTTEGWCRHTRGFRTDPWSQNAKRLSQADKQVSLRWIMVEVWLIWCRNGRGHASVLLSHQGCSPGTEL